jgi:hypothetical protein
MMRRTGLWLFGSVLLTAFSLRAADSNDLATLEPKTIGRVELHDALGSLKEVIERNWTVSQKPELFCFGLLERFDMRQLAALTAPRPVTFVRPSQRARQELSELVDWYQLLGGECDPVR